VGQFAKLSHSGDPHFPFLAGFQMCEGDGEPYSAWNGSNLAPPIAPSAQSARSLPLYALY
jgi:hypothetical protein